MSEIALLYSTAIILGLLVGSLLNVFIYRIPLMLREEYLQEYYVLTGKEPPDRKKISLNLFFPRSFCPSCKHTVKARHNVPVLSYLWLKGRCFHCQESISLRYPLVEFLSCAGTVLAVWQYGLSWPLLFVLLFNWIVIVLCFIDLDCQLLPDNLTLSLLWLGLIVNCWALFTDLPDAVLSAAAAWLILWLFINIFYLITGKIGMGHGDFKLFAAFGAWFGWMALPFVLFFASFVGAIVSFMYLKMSRQSRDTPVPFGPFLCLAGLVYLYCGEVILKWYLGPGSFII